MRAGRTRETERWRRKFSMSRARSSCARRRRRRSASGRSTSCGRGCSATTAAPTTPRRPTPATSSGTAARASRRCSNLPGEFIFDVQSHHVDPDGMWRVTNPAIDAFFAAVWPQSSPAPAASPVGRGRLDPRRRRRRGRPDPEPLALPLPEGAVPRLGDDDDGAVGACRPRRTPTTRCRSPRPRRRSTPSTSSPRSRRSVMHAFVMPNRGSARHTNAGRRTPSRSTSTRSCS